MNTRFHFAEGNFSFYGSAWACKPDFTNGERGSLQFEKLTIERTVPSKVAYNAMVFEALELNMLQELGLDVERLEQLAYDSWAANGFN